MKTMIHNLSKAKKSVIAALLCLSMVIVLLFVVPPVYTQAVEINAGDQGFTLYGAGTGTTTGFESGARISVTNITRTAENKKTAVYTYNGTAWSKAGNDYVVWQGNGANTFEAYTPVEDYASYTEFTLPADQTAGVSGVDWMTATYTGAKGETDTVDLSFQHLLSKVTVKVTDFGDQYKGDEILTAPAFLSNYNKATATYTTEGVTVTGSGSKTSVNTVWNADTKTATAILVPGSYNGQVQFFVFNVDGNSLSVHAPAELTLEAGKHYTFDLKVGKDSVLVNSVTVADWEKETLTGGVAKQYTEPFVSINGSTGYITMIPKGTPLASVESAVKGFTSDVTTIIVTCPVTAPEHSVITRAASGKAVFFKNLESKNYVSAGGKTYTCTVGSVSDEKYVLIANVFRSDVETQSAAVGADGSYNRYLGTLTTTDPGARAVLTTEEAWSVYQSMVVDAERTDDVTYLLLGDTKWGYYKESTNGWYTTDWYGQYTEIKFYWFPVFDVPLS